MPSLKRCRLGESSGEDDDNSGRKKRKTNRYYLLNLLSKVAAGIIPVNLHGLLGLVGAAGIIPKSPAPPRMKSKNRESAATAKTEV
ncbi:hypothetical protein C1H46_025826 [Malus baccata]|uniref:Uncharacterized protein n=1 Tax=Malus baccata TaxID=106549 RepID=A0A540LQ60_MALBA|nr:hypothetical protein C1H46_025826 [Malus baccata]